MSDRRVYELFTQALEAPDRDAFLASCGEWRDAVAALLKSHDTMDDDFLGVSASDRLHTFEQGDRIGRYTIRRAVAAGGGGTVYEAEQDQPRRTVALKVMRTGFRSDRFREEAEILARLEHPHIAHVYEAGVEDDVPFIAMEYVPGAATLVEHARGLERRAALELFAHVCDAVHHGHLKGVVHRDLKPDNILVRDGLPKVIDFGIASIEGAGAGEVAGTAAYMSPEQTRGEDVDARSDVYGLGVVLDRLAPGATGDLGAIGTRARREDREERYPSAAALAEDVRRFVRFEPVTARPPSLPHHVALFARRRPALLVALVALAATMIVGIVVSVRFAFRAEAARDEAVAQSYQSTIVAAGAALRIHDVSSARAQLERAPATLRNWEWRYLHARLDLSERTIEWPGEYLYAGAVAARAPRFAATSHGGARVWASDGSVLRTFPRPRPNMQVHCALSATGERCAIGYRDGLVEVRRVGDGELLHRTHVGAKVRCIHYAPDDRLLAVAAEDGSIHLFRDDEHSELARLEDGWAIALAFDSRAPRLYAGCKDGTIRCWDLESKKPLQRVAAHGDNVEDIALSPDGALLVSGSLDGTVRVWDTGPLLLRRTLEDHSLAVHQIAFAPDGKTFASGGFDRTVRVWQVPDGARLCVLHGHETMIRGLEYLPASQRLVSIGRGDRIKIWTLRRPAREFVGLSADVTGVEETVGGLIRAIDQTGAVLRWDRSTGNKVRGPRLVPPDERVFVSTDGKWAIAEKAYGNVRVEALRGKQEPRLLKAAPASLAAFAFAHEDDLLATGGNDGSVRVWNLRNGRTVAEFLGNTEVAHSLAFNRRDTVLAVGRASGSLELRRLAETAAPVTLAAHGGAILGVAFSPDDSRLASGGVDGTVRVWDPDRAVELLVLRGHRAYVKCVAWSTDGHRLYSGGGGETLRTCTVRVWEAPPR